MRLSRVWVLLALPLLFTNARADVYLDEVREAVCAIELGRYDEAATRLERARALSSDPLAVFALGVVYMHTGHLPEADGEFAKVGGPRSEYARNVIALSRGKSPSNIAADDLRSYLAHLAGEKTPCESGTALGLHVKAAQALFAGRDSEAAALLSDVLRTPAPLGFTEHPAPLATFDPKRPVALPKGTLTWKPMKVNNATVVSGVTVLRADTAKDGIDFVLFYIDDQMTGMTNCSPFQIDWDTRKYVNGLHRVRIEARGEESALISSKAVWARIANESSTPDARRTGPEADELWRRLGECVQVTTERKLAHYQLAKIFLAAGDKDKAEEQLEYAVAYQPDFADARRLLASLRGAGYAEISRGRVGDKMVALTFDDGPNEHTRELLQVLERLQVPATFFMVGFRAEGQPNLVREIQAAGHEIENHTYTHPRLTELTPAQAELELAKGAAVIRAITGKPSLFFRPPGGHADKLTKEAAGRQGLVGVFWTVNCSPYEGARYEEFAEGVIANAEDGAIILMHNGEPATTSALTKIVEALRAKGFRFVTISEMYRRVDASGRS
ncbi:MAG: polysaccharide deacetylase family protein [Armatimonadota bacterium]